MCGKKKLFHHKHKNRETCNKINGKNDVIMENEVFINHR